MIKESVISSAWSWRNILFFLLVLSLPFSLEYHFSPSLGTDLPDEPLMALVSLVFLTAAIYRPALLPLHFRSHPIIVLLILSLLWTLVTVIFSTHPLLSIKFLLAKSWYIGAFLLAAVMVFSERKNLILTALLLLISMFLVVLIVLIRHGLYGFQFATINKALLPFFRNHVNYSAMLVCLIPLAAAAYYLSAAYKKFWAFIMVIFLLALFFSYSRGAWLALPIGITAAWLASRKQLFKVYILALLVLAGSLFWISREDRYLRFAPDYRTTIFHENFSEHWVATYRLKDVSTAERFYRWVAGVRMIPDKWITGHGPNCFYEEYKPYAVPAFKTWVSNNEDHSTVHNYFLLTAIEQGIPGLMILLGIFGALIWYAEKKYREASDRFERSVALVIASMVSMMLVLNFLSDLIETDKIGSLYFLCMALLLASDKKEDHAVN